MRPFRFIAASIRNSSSPACLAAKEPWGQRLFARGTLTAALLLSIGCGASQDPDGAGSRRQSVVLPPVLELALNSAQKVAVGNDSQLIGGDAGSGGATSEVAFGKNTIQSPGRYALGHTVRVKTGGSIGTAYTFSAATLLNQGTVAGSVTGYSGASLRAVPAVAAVVPGNTDVLVPQFGSTTLCAGDFDVLEAQRGGTLILNAGTYNVGSLVLASEAKLFAAGRVVLRVAGDATLGRSVTLGPSAGSAADLRIETAGNFLMGETGTGKAHILAGGTVDLGNAVAFNGAAWAHGDIAVRIGALFTGEGQFSSTTPSIPSGDDSDLCTVDSCDAATGVHHTPVSADDGNDCTVDACAPLAGVSHTPVMDGTACSLGTCQAGVCTALSPRLAPGDAHSYFLHADGTVWAAGQNSTHFQLGNGGFSDSAVPVPVSGLSSVRSVASGHEFGLALKGDGTVWAWGENGSGQLGAGIFGDQGTPVPVSGLTHVVAIACGANHSLAIRDDGSLWAWGRNTDGQLGNGMKINSSTPVLVSGIGNVQAIAGGMFHSLAVKTDGTVWSWGSNGRGQLGDGSTIDHLLPGPVAGLSTATSVAAGYAHSLALLSNGTVVAWGDNIFGELGNGNFGPSSLTPTAVLNINHVTRIAAGEYHSLALTDTGVVLAFGLNNWGQLGGGPIGVAKNLPQVVSGLGNVVEIAAGKEHSMVLLDTGAVFGFGKNAVGAQGDGTSTFHTTPVLSLF